MISATCHPGQVVSERANSPVGFCSEQPAAAGSQPMSAGRAGVAGNHILPQKLNYNTTFIESPLYLTVCFLPIPSFETGMILNTLSSSIPGNSP